MTQHFLGIAHNPLSTVYLPYFGLNVDSIRLKFKLKLNGQSFFNNLSVRKPPARINNFALNDLQEMCFILIRFFSNNPNFNFQKDLCSLHIILLVYVLIVICQFATKLNSKDFFENQEIRFSFFSFELFHLFSWPLCWTFSIYNY